MALLPATGQPAVVVADDDADALRLATTLLRGIGLAVRAVASGEAALEALAHEPADLLITDLLMPGMDGEVLAARVRAAHPATAVVVMSAQGSIERAVALLQRGAMDYITKPFTPADFCNRVGAVVERLRLREEVRALREEVEAGLEIGDDVVLGTSPAMLRAWRKLRRVARTLAPVIVLGESGTGKEVLAQALHRWSPRAAAPFVTVNCASIPEGLWESELFGHRRGAFTQAVADHAGLVETARGGTLFLDEVGEIPLASQGKLLRFLESAEFRRVGDTRTQKADVRVVSATNRDLGAMAREGRFREDLFYRLNVVAIAVPPLRERLEDVPALAAHLLRAAASQFGLEVHALAPAAVAKLAAYTWPGNIRELRNKIQQAVAAAMGPVITADDLDLPGVGARRLAVDGEASAAGEGYVEPFLEARAKLTERFERNYVQHVLEQTHGNVSRAATLAQMPRKTLMRLIERHRLAAATSGRRGRPRREASGEVS